MRVVMTGATRGIGLAAAQTLVERAGVELIVGARGGSLPDTLRDRATLLPLDLSDLDSVRNFASAAAARGPIDALIGNAGLQCVHPKLSRQGYELTFAANHLGHFLLARELAPALARAGRVILTSSGTHDPDLKTGMPPPHHADAARLAHPEQDPERDSKAAVAGRRAYSASKLCNLMTVRELARRLADRPDLALLAFDPGFCPGTGLARDYGPILSAVFVHLMPLVVRGEGVSDPRTSGRALAAIAVDPAFAGRRGVYWSMRRKRPVEFPPSKLALDDLACARLWDDSSRMVGLPA